MNRAFQRIAYDRRTLAFLVVLGVLIAARELTWSSLFHVDQRLIDFRVFWCGGSVALHGADPYLFEPLRSCEHRYGAGLFDLSANFVMPFVLPPYDIAPLTYLARLPYGTAAWFFTALNAIALLGGIVLVAASVRVPVVLAAATLVVSIGLPSLWLGQIVPLELIALAATAFALARGRDAVAGACAALSLLEPHVGIFVVTAVFVLVRRSRVALGCSLAVLTYLSFRAADVAPIGVYLATLGAHTRAEAGSYGQYSLTFLLRYLHTPMDVAVVLGAVSSAVLLIVGVVLARALDGRGIRTAIVYVPVACAVIGGSFVHLTQIALAIPAALLVYANARDALTRRLGAFALIVLVVPWPIVASNKQTLACALLVVAVTTWYVTGRTYRWALAAVAAAWIALIPLQNTAQTAPAIPAIVSTPGALASDAWKQALDQMTADEPRYVLLKLVTWAALLALFAASVILRRDAPLRATTPRAAR